MANFLAKNFTETDFVFTETNIIWALIMNLNIQKRKKVKLSYLPNFKLELKKLKKNLKMKL